MRLTYTDGRTALTTTAFRYKLTTQAGVLVKDWTTDATWTEEPAGTYYLDDADAVPGTVYAVEPATGEVGGVGTVPLDATIAAAAVAIQERTENLPDDPAGMAALAAAHGAGAWADQPSDWVEITDATLDTDGSALGVIRAGGQPVVGALVIVFDDAGALVNTAYTITGGHFAVRVPGDATYTMYVRYPKVDWPVRTVTIA